ncbi:hypothetical protein BHE74_00037987 [Ensete ventricosum]|nr:hypothetical protein GW17_00010628 [Ensete ventricosum]RWW55383.1 hypothetical protein BHE74_00037987 [Ensete ventricosum]
MHGELTVPVEEITPAQELADPHGSGIGQISKIAGSSNRQVGFPGSTFPRPGSQIPGTRQSSEGPHRHHTPVDGVLLRGLNLRLLDAGRGALAVVGEPAEDVDHLAAVLGTRETVGVEARRSITGREGNDGDVDGAEGGNQRQWSVTLSIS